MPPRFAVVPNDLLDRTLRIDLRVRAVAIGRFDDEVIGFCQRLGLQHDRIVVPTKVAGKCDRGSLPPDLNPGSPQDVAGASEHQICAARQAVVIVKRCWLQQTQGRFGILYRVERKSRLMFGEAALVGKSRILLLQMPRVAQQHLA